METYRNVDEAVRLTTRKVATQPFGSAPRGMGTSEIRMETFRIEDPRDRLFKGTRKGYAAAKVMWDFARRDDIASLVRFNPRGKDFSDDGEHVQGENYGQRWTWFLDEALHILREQGDSRRVWVPIWKPFDLVNEVGHWGVEDWHESTFPSRESSNIPCTLGFAFRVDDGRLVMQSVMRSQNVMRVMPYDLFLFTCIQEIVALELGLELGTYEHCMLSAHVYERDFGAVDEDFLDRESGEAPMKTLLPYSDARVLYPRFLANALGEGDNHAATWPTDPLFQMIVNDPPSAA